MVRASTRRRGRYPNERRIASFSDMQGKGYFLYLPGRSGMKEGCPAIAGHPFGVYC
jgi:hypothetical protein